MNGLRNLQVVEYNGLLDFGDWGIRENRQTKAYTMAGSQGLMLEFFQGKALLIGTQQTDSCQHFKLCKLYKVQYDGQYLGFAAAFSHCGG
jgi:hypothetical protein